MENHKKLQTATFQGQILEELLKSNIILRWRFWYSSVTDFCLLLYIQKVLVSMFK